jgi:hypothetical protein
MEVLINFYATKTTNVNFYQVNSDPKTLRDQDEMMDRIIGAASKIKNFTVQIESDLNLSEKNNVTK